MSENSPNKLAPIDEALKYDASIDDGGCYILTEFGLLIGFQTKEAMEEEYEYLCSHGSNAIKSSSLEQLKSMEIKEFILNDEG